MVGYGGIDRVVYFKFLVLIVDKLVMKGKMLVVMDFGSFKGVKVKRWSDNSVEEFVVVWGLSWLVKGVGKIIEMLEFGSFRGS